MGYSKRKFEEYRLEEALEENAHDEQYHRELVAFYQEQADRDQIPAAHPEPKEREAENVPIF